MSILISIIIAVVIVYITVFLDYNNDVTVVEQYVQAQFAKYVLSVHVVGDLFFLMMFVIARLTNRTILVECVKFKQNPYTIRKIKDFDESDFHYSACTNCLNKCNNFQKIYNKSAYIVYYNILMFVLYAILYYWWILDYYVKGQRWFVDTSDFWFVVSLGVFVVLALLFVVVFGKINNYKSKNEQYIKIMQAKLEKINRGNR